jgi:hypothetical protein
VGLDCIFLLDRAGIPTSATNYYNSEVCSSRRVDWGLEYKLKQDTEVGYVAMKTKY